MTKFSLVGKKVWIAGHKGLVGQALIRRLESEHINIVTIGKKDLDLRDSYALEKWMKEHMPDVVIIAAAKVGGIWANNAYPAEFIYDNLMISANIIHQSYRHNVSKLLFLGSSCIYPKLAKQPIQEHSLLSGPLESTNQWYAIAKIAGLKMCEAYYAQYGCSFISAMPTNLYGVGDTYHALNSHVIPALIMKIHEAKEKQLDNITLWGSGNVKREFLYVDDLADACVFLLKNYKDQETINVGWGEDQTIRDLAHQISNIIGYKGKFCFDVTQLEGTPQKLLDITRIKNLGWNAQISLKQGLKLSYHDYLERFIK